MSAVHVVEATSRELRMAEIAIRWDVFVVEQGVEPVLEIDARDFRDDVVHLAALEDGTERALGVVRLIPDGDDHYHLGRLAVRIEARGSGAGAALVRAVHDLVARRTPAGREGLITLDAQIQAMGFYRRLGYAETGSEPFLDAGIWHRTMSRTVQGEASPSSARAPGVALL
ncbi:MAG: GNAT family N-acetyltransferase [Actinomyces sp.]|nr:GNAT family N-acetyltransferase [Actinomyces sp.]MCI1641281.1 GNAT family N-acetyltransferase [Actinomyces sp.]MCI1662100.1 GNAT family N-acetyltransferase [Actinomyces sp.]MCI1690917.1 GNAT family N-acetyltransferase [Actinomyces sp.]MCI1786902.1 GNAT family N-acetyltransferase [Actinomyces sp.]MCI1828956.1 GNAT family N-acetyltransferase [Actinomyces sp.]